VQTVFFAGARFGAAVGGYGSSIGNGGYPAAIPANACQQEATNLFKAPGIPATAPVPRRVQKSPPNHVYHGAPIARKLSSEPTPCRLARQVKHFRGYPHPPMRAPDPCRLARREARFAGKVWTTTISLVMLLPQSPPCCGL